MLPQTFVQKVIAGHAARDEVQPGEILAVDVDFVACDDLSFPAVAKKFRELGADSVFDPDRVLISADHDSPARTLVAAERWRETRQFASSLGIEHVLDAGEAGIVHVVLPELGLIAPGDLVVGCDSHALTAGGLGALAIGVGVADTAVALAFGEIWLRVPETVRITIDGAPGRWVGPKDVALAIVTRLGQSGCLYAAVEYEGSYVRSAELDARLTLANMAIEMGAKSAATEPTAAEPGGPKPLWRDPDAIAVADYHFDVTSLGPMVSRAGGPDRAVDVEELAGQHVDQVFIGTCTNGRLSDLRVAAEVIRGRSVAPGTRLLVVPGSPGVARAALRAGILEALLDAGAVIGPPGCGPCAGLHMGILAAGEVGVATSSRNFPGRMGSSESELFLTSPAVAAASAVAGHITSPDAVL